MVLYMNSLGKELCSLGKCLYIIGTLKERLKLMQTNIKQGIKSEKRKQKLQEKKRIEDKQKKKEHNKEVASDIPPSS